MMFSARVLVMMASADMGFAATASTLCNLSLFENMMICREIERDEDDVDWYSRDIGPTPEIDHRPPASKSTERVSGAGEQAVLSTEMCERWGGEAAERDNMANSRDKNDPDKDRVDLD